MAHAVFTLEDSKEARTELSLLLQIESSQLSVLSHNGLITVEFPDLAEVTALQVLSRAVSNHGFVVDMRPASKDPFPIKKTALQAKQEQKVSTELLLDGKPIGKVKGSK